LNEWGIRGIFNLHQITNFMTDYYLRQWGDPILRTLCDPVENFSSLEDLIHTMREIMHSHNGLGISALQVGETKRVLLAMINGKATVFINPQITKSRGYIPTLEDCLSLPGLFLPKIRRYSIEVQYQDENGKEKSASLKGLNSIVLQHEMDHLNGKLIFHYFK